MKKTKLFLLLVSVLCLVLVFASCSLSNSDFEDVYSSSTVKYQNQKAYSSAILLDQNSTGGISVSAYGNFIVIRKAGSGLYSSYTYSIYHEKSQSKILTLTSNTYSSYSISAIDDVLVVVNSENSGITSYVTTTIYDSKGSQIAYCNGSKSVTTINDLYLFDGKYYRATSNGSLSQVGISGQNAVVQCEAITDNYYVDLTSSAINVYDKSFNPKYSYKLNAPSNSQVVDSFVLDNGNVIICQAVVLPSDDKSFDFYMPSAAGEQKYDVSYMLLDVEDLKVSKLSFSDYMLTDVLSREENEEAFEGLNSEIQNIACLAPAKNKSFETNQNNYVYAVMDNEGKLGKSLMIDDEQIGVLSPSETGSYFMMKTASGYKVFNAQGVQVSSFTKTPVATTKDYIIFSDSICTYNMSNIYQLNSNQSISKICRDGIMVVEVDDSGYTTYYNYNGTLNQLISISPASYGDTSVSTVSSQFQGYAVYSYNAVSGFASYTYYNNQGYSLVTTDTSLSFVAETELGCILGNSKEVYLFAY